MYLPGEWYIPRNGRICVFHMGEAIPACKYLQYIIKVPSITCNLSHPSASSETILHVSPSCTKLALITDKHWQVTKFFPQQLIKQLHVRNAPCFPHPKYEPQVVFENDTHQLYWNCDLLMNNSVPFNWPDIILVDITNKEAALIGIANLLTHSLQATITEKQSIYQELAFDNRQQWQPNKITVTPFVLAANRSSITCLTKASLPSIYRHAYCPRSRK